MSKPQVAVNQQVQGWPDYAVSGFTPPSGVTDRQMVRSIQANLGVKQDGVWGSKTQTAWEKQYSDLWQKDTKVQQSSSKGYTPPKGIDGSEEIKQVQQRLYMKVDGIWGKDTQEAWDKMRSPQTAYKAPKGIDSKEEIQQVQQRLRVEPSGVWDGKTQEAWNKMRSPQIKKTSNGIDSEDGIRQVQQQFRVDPSGLRDDKAQEVPSKMNSSQITYQAPKGIDSGEEIR